MRASLGVLPPLSPLQPQEVNVSIIFYAPPLWDSEEDPLGFRQEVQHARVNTALPWVSLQQQHLYQERLQLALMLKLQDSTKERRAKGKYFMPGGIDGDPVRREVKIVGFR